MKSVRGVAGGAHHLPAVIALPGILIISALAACGTVSDTTSASPGAEPSGSAADLAIVACPESGPVLATADPGQRMLVTGRSADGAWLRVHVPGPVSNHGWAPAAALELDGDLAQLPTVSCGVEPAGDRLADDFRLVTDPNDPPAPLGPPPGDQLIQLVSYNQDAPSQRSGERAPWWTPAGVPRVDHITQFDGGPLHGGNAVPAAGAMLARLGFGIVTTGSQLRTLDPDQEGGTSFASLAEVLADRGDVIFSQGYLASADLRELLSSGAGAVIAVDYGSIPEAQRQQPDFIGSHAIYIDGVRPASSTNPAAYYVLDPMAISSRGYIGDWWPADIVDRAAMAFGERRIVALWAFAGGVNPAPPPSGAGPLDAAIGDDPSPAVPDDADRLLMESASRGGLVIEPILGVCVESPTQADCPPGLQATYQPPASGLSAEPRPSGVGIGQGPLDLLYTDVPQPGLWRTFIDGPTDLEPTFSYWLADGSGPLLQADPVAAMLGGKQVWMVTVPIPQTAGDFAFLASTVEAGVVNATEVGAISFGN